MDAAQGGEVLRLSLGKDQPALNVLSREMTEENLSVECPFPVLKLAVPVQVTLPGQQEQGPVSATIHRIGVIEGETGIPRFKLQLALESPTDGATVGSVVIDLEESDAIEEKASFEGVVKAIEEGPEDKASEDDSSFEEDDASFDGLEEEDEASLDDFEEEPEDEASFHELEETASLDAFDKEIDESTESADNDTEETLDLGASRTDEELDEFNWPLSPELEEAEALYGSDGEPSEDAEDTVEVEEDPPWVDGDFEPPVDKPFVQPEEKSRWPVRVAVAAALLISVVAVAYVLRSQIMDAVSPYLSDGEITLASFGLEGLAEPAEADLAERAPLEPPIEEVHDVLEAGTHAVATASEPAQQQPGDGPSSEAEPEAGENVDNLVSGASEEQPEEGNPLVQDVGGSVRVMLPTQWPVSEARSYRLHDPTGIVVDVPGGMPGRTARWIDTSNDRVRSVRVLEREDGVRFIIYLNDTHVPRYRVGYSRTGVTVDILGPDPRHVASK